MYTFVKLYTRENDRINAVEFTTHQGTEKKYLITAGERMVIEHIIADKENAETNKFLMSWLLESL